MALLLSKDIEKDTVPPLPPRYRLRDLIMGDYAFNDDGERFGLFASAIGLVMEFLFRKKFQHQTLFSSKSLYSCSCRSNIIITIQFRAPCYCYIMDHHFIASHLKEQKIIIINSDILVTWNVAITLDY
ncbi:PREDICTED: uncharacterized protein LOC108565489 [Nicrophorus vespilloides]|uniref:Uncharacterized protein LOC108565489 n=1 Tax=Nicrophorus vespilloides TaxID=110193 RepID=A0ABM1N0Y3_NICVS|nr:PREDICTED: uncharacterized protein LOC108565489 [Nicrophorus vespilloides]